MAAVGERAAVRRLVERVGLGPRPGELDAAVARGFEATRDAILSAVDDPRAVAAPSVGDGRDRNEQATIALWWLERMVGSNAPVVERVTWFWHGHFATSVQKVRSARLMLGQNGTLRGKGLGDFGELARAMVVDPAMLIWLDGQKNTAKAANENLARELMELFTLGVGNYSEQDVREAARALTGWRVDRDTGVASLNPKQQDKGSKTVLGRSGPLDADGLVDVLVTQPVSAKFVAQRMWFRFVSSANPPDEGALQRLTGAYGAGRNVASLLRALVDEPGFRDDRNTVVKQPVEWVVGLMRALNIRPSALPEGDRTKLLAGLRGMGQVPFVPPSVGGWPAGAAWLTTSAALARVQVARLLAAKANLDALKGGDPVGAVGALLGVEWSERTRKALAMVAKSPEQLAAVAATAPEYAVSG